MSAHPIAEPHFGDRSDVQPIVSDARKSRDSGDGRSRHTTGAHLVQGSIFGLAGQPAVNPWVMSRARSCLDRLVAGLILIALLPAMLVIVLVVRLTSAG